MKRRVGLIFISWLSMIGFDLFLHAGLLARLYTKSSPFLLPANQAFLRIPLGYLSFLVIAIILIWFMESRKVVGWKSGLIFGLKFGALLWLAHTLGLYSISTASWDLLLGWGIGQALELGIAGIVIGLGLAGKRLSRLVLWVVVFVVVMMIITIVLQTVGFAPPMKIV
ncbi:hypothetical protein ACFLQQ_00085 [Actinomycetota bacterium]